VKLREFFRKEHLDLNSNGQGVMNPGFSCLKLFHMLL
jgi:hypothetical protein